MALPSWLQGKNSFEGIKYGKLEDRADYQEIKERRSVSVPISNPEPIVNKPKSILFNNPNPINKFLLTKPIIDTSTKDTSIKNKSIFNKPVDNLLDKHLLTNKNLPISKQAPKTGYDKFKEESVGTPNWLKPLGYALETPWRIPATQRLLTKANEFLGAESIDQKGNKIKPMSTGNKIVDGGIDVGGAIIGAGFTGGRGSNLLTGTDRIAELGGMKIAGKTGSKLLGAYGRGAIDAGASTAIEGLAKGKPLKQTAKDTAINSLFGGAMFAGAKGIGDVIPKVGNLLTPQGLKNQGVNNAFEQTFNKKFGEYRKLNIPTEKAAKEVSPSVPLKGKFTVKNTALEKATIEYEDAIQTIQNHFQTNKLIPSEIPRIKSELGIDINKLADNLANARTSASQIGSNSRLKATAGVTDLPSNLQRPITSSFKEVASTIEQPLKPITSNFNQGNVNPPLSNKLLPSEPLQGINTKTSQFKTNTLKNSEFLADAETQKVIKNIAMEYEVKPNAQTVNKAMQDVTNDFDSVVNRIKNTEQINGVGALNSAEDSAASALITNRLRLEAKQTGDYTKVKEWLEVLQPKVTNTAQSLQALKTWKDLSPEGTIFKAQQVVGTVNREGTKLYGKNFKPIELTTDEIKHIGDSMEDVIKMPETTPAQIKAKERAFAKVKSTIGDKVPATMADKVKALQRISLLLNPKTNIRNVLGNTILNTLENTKDFVSAPVDMLTSALKTGQRTTLLPSFQGLQTQGKGMIKGLKTVIGDAKAGVNTSQSVGQFEITGDRIFNNKILNGLDKTTNTALRFGDEPFYQAAYDESLRQQLKIGKVTEPTKDMLENAKLFAQDRTLQNTSAISEAIKGIQKGINKLTGDENIGLGTFAVPFVKTPANILDKAIDYSPVGSLKAITQLMTKKTFNQKLFVDRIGRSVIGTGGIMLGYDLAKKGMITGQSNKDKDVAALDRQMGKSAYSIKSGDTYRTFDWAAPASIMLAIGADMYQEGKTSKDVGNVSVKAITSGVGTLFKQSLLQGFQKLFGYNDLVGGLVQTALNVPTQFVPTALKQTAQLKDANLKDTYDPNSFKQLGNQLKAKVPGLSSRLPTKIDTLGRETKQFQGKNNAFNVLVNPGFTTKNVSNETEKFVSKLYEETGLKTHFPKVANKTITYKVDSQLNKTISLTPSEKVELQKYIGQRTDKEFQAISKEYEKNSSDARNMKSATTQVKELGNLLSDIYADGEKKVLEGRKINEYNKKNRGDSNNPRY